MAEQLPEYEFASNGTAIYPWKTWENGKTYRVTCGVDFTCTPESFVTYLYHRAGNRGWKVKTSTQRTDPVKIVFRFIRRTKVSKPKKRVKKPQTKKVAKKHIGKSDHGNRQT